MIDLESIYSIQNYFKNITNNLVHSSHFVYVKFYMRVLFL